MRIAVAGAGYVGLSLSVLLAQTNTVKVYEVIQEKVDMINSKISPIKDKEIEEYLRTKDLNLMASNDFRDVFKDVDYIIIATPTNYDVERHYFDTSSIESTIDRINEMNSEAIIVIKSTIPVGYVAALREEYDNHIFFSPEFLREGKALYDNLYPSRIICGDHSKEAIEFAKLLADASLKEDVATLFTGMFEAEAIKLFANSYLAMRVTFFNELDTYAELHDMSSSEIIQGVSLDPRIGNHYNNPSFGYGGYCLPKDTKQLLVNFENTPNQIIKAIVDGNDTRKIHVTERILSKKPKLVGIYRLIMKSDSDNFRSSAIQDIMHYLDTKGVKVVVYEPIWKEEKYMKFEVVNDFNKFVEISDVIVTNRYDHKLDQYYEKVYTRDQFNKD